MNPARCWWIAGWLSLAACTGLPVADYGTADALPAQVELESVPFHPQEAYQCGPAALATLLGAAGAKRTAEQLKDEVYLPQRQGSLQAELLGATRRAGLLPHVLTPAPQALLAELAAGHPVLVLQDVGHTPVPRWHYAAVVGYDRPARQLILRSGTERRQTMSFDDFDRSWAKGGRWAFVALPPDRLPADTTEDRFVAAALTLELVSPNAGIRAYGTALERWPGNLLARIALGNVAYRRQDLEGAEAAYRMATIYHPESADAWNNLAQVLHRAGRNREARMAAQRAVAIGGPRWNFYRSTLAAIERGAVP